MGIDPRWEIVAQSTGPSAEPVDIPGQADRLAASRRLVISAVSFFALSFAFLVLDQLVRRPHHPNGEMRSIVRVLDLDSLALIPSGRTGRMPLPFNPAVDLRFDPNIPRIRPDLAELLLAVPNRPNEAVRHEASSH